MARMVPGTQLVPYTPQAGTQDRRSTGPGSAEGHYRQKLELRAYVQEATAEFARLQRERLLPRIRAANPEATEEQVMDILDQMQPAYEQYDPVVAMSLVAVDHTQKPDVRFAANKEVAQYLRPKLKSVEHKVTESSEEEVERQDLASRIAGLLDEAATGKRATADAAPVEEKD